MIQKLGQVEDVLAGQFDDKFDLEVAKLLAKKKRPGVRCAAWLLFLALLPAMAVIAILVKLTSRGPVLYLQTRMGQYGEEFTIYKFRTMVVNAESGVAVWCQKNDPRVTWLGKHLRRLHLDELPQIVNIAMGEMDFVGPRPERPSIVRNLVGDVVDYESRLLVRPGITGLAQINLPPDETIDCVRRKVNLDAEYIQTATLWLDLRIIAYTGLLAVGLDSRRLLRAMKLCRVPQISLAAEPPLLTMESNSAPVLQQASSR